MRTHFAFAPLLLVVFHSALAESTQTAVSSSLSALEAYQTGFAFGTMKDPSGEGVCLQDWALIENDGPGAGRSEKGPWMEPLHKGILVKKLLHLDNPAARSAKVVIYLESLGGKGGAPYYLVVNGHRVEGIPTPWHEGLWRWISIPPDILVAGKNEIVVGCDAEPGQGYNVLVAREDEYDAGGGKFSYHGNTALISSGQVKVPAEEGLDKLEGTGFEPIEVGQTSLKSLDGGQTWKRYVLGATEEITGEYSIRLSLERYQPEGFLRSPVIDLWEGAPGAQGILPSCAVQTARLMTRSKAPEGTSVRWKARFSNTPDPTSEDWSAYQDLGQGEEASFELSPKGNRFLQWEAGLSTTDPLVSPVVQAATVERTLSYEPLPEERYYVRSSENPDLLYSTYHFYYEDYGQPQLKTLETRLGLQEVVAGAQGDFEKINRLRHYVSTQWHHGSPFPEYPEWNANAILDRRDQCGKGGMCIQFSIVFIQSLLSQGYQARHLNIFSHETVEVYIDELGKWVHVDPESVFDSYEYNTLSGEPVNVLEQHGYFLEQFGLSKQNPIDWMNPNPWCNWPAQVVKDQTQPLAISTFTDWINDPDPAKRPPQHRLAGFIRMMPRNDYFSRPTPRPLAQGAIHWPWNGYLNWYDEATPRKLQYALHSDRKADFYPTLNRVHWTATAGKEEGEIEMKLVSFTPNFETYEINLNGSGWKESGDEFTWNLRPSGLNRLEMRTRNRAGVPGYPSHLEVFWHYREPYQPKPKDW